MSVTQRLNRYSIEEMSVGAGIVAALLAIVKGAPLKLLLSLPLMAFLEYFLPNDPTAWIACGGLIVADFVFGILAACKDGTFKTQRMMKGVGKIGVLFIILGCAEMLGRTSVTMMQWAPEFIYAYIGIMEFLSILENAHKLGFVGPLPRLLQAAIRGRIKDVVTAVKNREPEGDEE